MNLKDEIKISATIKRGDWETIVRAIEIVKKAVFWDGCDLSDPEKEDDIQR